MKNIMKRVDFQVTLVSTIMVTLSTLICFFIVYSITYNDLKNTLTRQADLIYEMVDRKITTEDMEGMQKGAYINIKNYTEVQTLLYEIDKVTIADYIFTTTKNKEGVPVYYASNMKADNPNFVEPGVQVVDGTLEYVKKSLEGKIVKPDGIKNSKLGKFVAYYYPIIREETVIGSVGILFEVTTQYNTYHNLRIYLPMIIIAGLIIIAFISFILFRKISNPSFYSLANTDLMTGVKNRNAFDLDINNLNARARYKNIGIVLFDLNGLKEVNDRLGHDFGDIFIKSLGKAYLNIKKKKGTLYRIGGDEFALLIPNATDEIVIQALDDIKKEFYKLDHTKDLTYSQGYAIYDVKLDESLYATFKRADVNMYNDKKKYKN